MDEVYEERERVLSIIRGGEESYSSITDFKQNLGEEVLAHEKLEKGWVLYEKSELTWHCLYLIPIPINATYKQMQQAEADIAEVLELAMATIHPTTISVSATGLDPLYQPMS
ncbi:uncharacterized protein LOC121803955 [Salvia splendens]|uniref:uncharacterized protein LOC121803955 n=1 Tax=Salvia splendens TaxID=180675 RepID=UPI001C26A526|nr:uncharacterized protein LOC121803955 [Salvia splendens]